MPRRINFRDSRGRFTKKLPYQRNVFFYEDTLSKGIAQFRFKMSDAIVDKLLDFAVELVDYMRARAPWEDRTGNARAGLDADVFAEGDEIGITLFDHEDYEVWLEVRWGGRYAIIIPTVEQKGPQMLAELRGMMDRIIFYA